MSEGKAVPHGWRSVRLEEVAERTTEKNKQGYDHVMTVSSEHGLVQQEQFFTKRVAAKDLSGYRVVQPGDLVYNKSTSKRAPWGVVARHGGSEPAVVTTLYITFRARPDMVNPEYLLMACNSAYFFESLQGMLREGARSHGLLNVRLKEFFRAELLLPSMQEQARVVDLLKSANAVLRGAAKSHEVLRELFTVALGRAYEVAASEETARLADICDLRSGISWTKDETAGPGDEAVAAVGVAHVQRHGVEIDAPATCLKVSKKTAGAAIAANSLLMIRTNGNPTRIGNVQVAPPVFVGRVLSGFLFGLTPRDASDRDFLLRMLQSPQVQSQITDTTSGSTGLRNIAISALREITIPWPAGETRSRLVADLEAVDETALLAKEEAQSVESLVAALSAAVLQANVDIPESYDRFIDGRDAASGSAETLAA